MLVDVDQPGADETATIAGTPIKMTETPPSVDGRALLLDEHRDELLDAAANRMTGHADRATETVESSTEQG